MRKIISWIRENILFLFSLFLLAFIPLYPKLPLLDVKNTWVYIRVEDFLVLFVFLFWLRNFFKRKITLKTPLTLPILIFWIIGAIATLHGVLIIFPTIANVFPNVAFLSFIRHIEYMSLFFIAYSSMKDKRFIPVVVAFLVMTFLAVVFYGFGQKYLEFPAFLTMNEEFAKGIPIQLSQLSRVPSTFAGHYDLAAYLVLVIPILVSLFFGFKNWLIKIFLIVSSVLGFGLLFMTVSRVSFFVLLIALLVVLFFQKRKSIIFLVPLIAIASFIFLSFQPSLLNRFGNTVDEVDVLIDGETGDSIGHVKYVPVSYFEDKIIKEERIKDKEDLLDALQGDLKESPEASTSPDPLLYLPPEVPLVKANNISTGESLPQGSGYINLSLSPVTKRVGNFLYEFSPDTTATTSAEVLILHGNFLIKRAAAYDLSFTTRFQGEWPRALEAFRRNILFGSGYGSVSLAVDNNYLRMLGEIGAAGVISFFAIFLVFGIYIKKILPDVDSSVAKSLIIGFIAGAFGLSLNAILIDVFEASKIAFIFWILAGVILGILSLYQTQYFKLRNEIRNAILSPLAVVIYLFIGTFIIFSPMINNFFVGDDFTWFRWAADCSNCSFVSTIYNYFTDANGFFYRPGTKIYFFLMYKMFWLNQVVYHLVSLFSHFAVIALFYLLARKILKNNYLSVLASFLFLVMSGYSEVVFWISSTGHLFNSIFILLSLLFFIYWEEKKKIYFYILSIVSIIISLLFHELGVVAPILIIGYKISQEGLGSFFKLTRKAEYYLLFLPLIPYAFIRFTAQSHWFNGDYSYDILKLPFNVVGNLIGYFSLTVIGSISLPFYEMLRNLARENLPVALAASIIGLIAVIISSKKFIKYFTNEEKKVVIFGALAFVITLLPFLGLGNITSRYSYLGSLGIVLIFTILIKKLYPYLKDQGREIAIGVTVLSIIAFALFHVIQVQQVYRDWHGAGEKSRNFFISIDNLYSNFWSEKNVELHFVDVPLKVGEAWVFPVGLNDAVWFAFNNPDLKIFIHNDLDDALKLSGTSLSKPVLKFGEDGGLEEVVRFKKPTPAPSSN